MRIMEHRLDMPEDGYVISNTDDAWDAMPQRGSFIAAPLRVIPKPSKVDAHLDDCVEVVDLGEDTDPEFYKRETYLKALHGDLPGWRLIGVQVSDVGVYFRIAHELNEYGDWEELCIKPSTKHTCFDIEAPSYNGSINCYTIVIGYDKAYFDDGKPYFLRVTEYHSDYKRDLIFQHYSELRKLNAAIDAHRMYVTVREYR